MKKILILGLLLSTMVLGNEVKKPKDIKIGITQIVEHPALDASREGFEKALKDLGYGDVKIEYQNSQGDFGTAQMIAQSYVGSKKDMIYAISTPSAQAAYNATKTIPILITAVTDPKSAGLTGDNITGTSDAIPVKDQLEIIKELLPKVKNVGIIYNTSEQNSIVQVKAAQKAINELGLKLIETGVTAVTDIPSALDAVLKKIDVLYIPTDNLIVSATPLVLDKANKQNIPVIGCIEDQVKQGALITKTIDYEKLGYQTGEMAVKILEGKNPKDLPIETMKEMQIIVNTKAAKKYGVDISNPKLKDAKLY